MYSKVYYLHWRRNVQNSLTMSHIPRCVLFLVGSGMLAEVKVCDVCCVVLLFVTDSGMFGRVQVCDTCYVVYCLQLPRNVRKG